MRCPKCGEPWDFDTLHDEVSDRIAQGTLSTPTIIGTYRDGHPRYDQASYEQAFNAVKNDFYRRGCPALYGATCNTATRVDPAISELYDLLGDDIDGAEAMLADFGLSYAE